jgi:hypothetical protein
MKLAPRIAIAAVLLAAGLAGKIALSRHVEKAGELPRVPLLKPLEEFPLQLGEWQGQDQEIEENLQYGDDHLQRLYYHPGRQQYLSIWMAYSGVGLDRGHHPEVCMAVAGKPEDPSVRGTLDCPGHEAPVQQYRFGRTGERQWVFYWYYTLPPPPGGEVDDIQRLYQRMRQRPSSITVEVFAPEKSADDVNAAQEFVLLLDAALQEHLSPTAKRGSQRTPVTYVEAAAPPEGEADAPAP